MTLFKRSVFTWDSTGQERQERLGWAMALLPGTLFLLLLGLQGRVARSGPLVGAYEWVPSLGVSLGWHIDGLSLLFGLLISGVGALVFVYAGGYLAGDPMLGRFYLYLSIFLLAMLGMVLAGDLLLLFVFWEVTSISSYLLIGYKHSYRSSRDAALQALLVTGGGGLALLAGVLLLGQMGGSFVVADLIAQREEIQAHPLFVPALALVLLGAFTKSAQFPFHFWLPNAMAAPTPVSAYLHSATMVKAGVYLLARLTPVLGGNPVWSAALMGAGAVTMLLAAFLAWQQTDLKRILAYTTVSALGTLVLLLGVGTTIALKAALLFLLVHALYKGALFMIAGAVEHQTGSRDIRQLGGLWRAMPLTGTAALLAALSMSGIPPLAGFVGKELFYEATLYAPTLPGLLTAAAVATNVLTILAAGLATVRPFGGDRPAGMERPREAGISLLLGPVVLAGAGLLAGVAIGQTGKGWIEPALAGVLAAPVSVKLSLWHGVNPMLLLSLLTVALALGLWFVQARLWALAARLDVGQRFGPQRGYTGLLSGLVRTANWQTRLLQHGYLRLYAGVVLATATGLVSYTVFSRNQIAWNGTWSDLRLHEVGVLVLMLGAAATAITAASRMVAIVAVGVVGLGMTLLFVLYSAPDLAMTQMAVETLTVLLFVFVVYRLPNFVRLTRRWERLRDGGLALLVGGLMASLVLVAVQSPHPMHVSDYYAAQSWIEANGRNVVNVILVDFRALDTLGEVVVLIVAALGVHALIRPLLRESGRQGATATDASRDASRDASIDSAMDSSKESGR